MGAAEDGDVAVALPFDEPAPDFRLESAITLNGVQLPSAAPLIPTVGRVVARVGIEMRAGTVDQDFAPAARLG